jgi:GWxTD domain-containing protein
VKALTVPAALLLAAVVSGCGPPLDAGRPAQQAPAFYVPGLPYFYSEVDVDLPPGVTPDTAAPELQVNLLLYVPNASLSFLKAPDGYEARFDVTTLVTDPETGETLRERSWTEQSVESRFEDTRLYNPHIITRSVVVPPGRYDLEIRVQDLDNRKQVVRRHRVEVADLRARGVLTGMVRLEGRRTDGTVEPAIVNTIRRSTDSLRLRATLLTLRPPVRLEGSLHVLRVPVDTTVALPPYTNPTMGALILTEFIGLGGADTVHTARWSVSSEGKRTELEVRIPNLPAGVYRIDAGGAMEGERLDRTAYRWSRWFAVRSQDYPRPATLDDLVEALRYIATEREWLAIDSVSNPRERKRRFDQFWVTLAGSGPAAANLLKTYYGRVQEANLFFSAHKEGWRTDRGMVYIVLGPPPVVERRLEDEVWRYGAMDDDPLTTFAFRRGVSSVAGVPFENHVLNRQFYYDRIWVRGVERWRSGRIF